MTLLEEYWAWKRAAGVSYLDLQARALEAFAILDGFDLAASGHNTANTLHLVAEASRRASADRVAYVGDPDFVDIDWSRLTSANTYRAIRPSWSRICRGPEACGR